MNKASQADNIEALIKEIDPEIKVNHNYIYGYTDASLMASLVYSHLAVLDMEYYIIVFAEDKLVLLGISMAGNLTGDHGVIPYTDITSFKVRSGLLQYVVSVEIKGVDQKLKFKCNKKIMGMGWQKENIDYMAGLNWNGL